MKGRKPKPSMLHELHGLPRGRKTPVNEPKPVGDLAEPPEWLSDDQKAGWAYAITHAPPALLKRIDRGVLTVWIGAESLHRQAMMQQALHGLVIKAPITGTPIQSPYLAIINRQAQIMLKAAGELGFSPVSRPRIGAVAPMTTAVRLGARADEQAAPKVSLDDFLENAPTIN